MNKNIQLTEKLNRGVYFFALASTCVYISLFLLYINTLESWADDADDASLLKYVRQYAVPSIQPSCISCSRQRKSGCKATEYNCHRQFHLISASRLRKFQRQPNELRKCSPLSWSEQKCNQSCIILKERLLEKVQSMFRLIDVVHTADTCLVCCFVDFDRGMINAIHFTTKKNLKYFVEVFALRENGREQCVTLN